MTVILVHDDDDAAATLADDCVYVCAGVIVGIIYISDAQFTAPTRVPNLRNTKYFLFANIFRRITPFKKSTTYLDLALKDKHNDT